MNWFSIKFLLFTIFLKNFINCEYFSSIYQMSFLMDNELKMLQNIDTFITKNENKLDYLKEKLSEYEREREEVLSKGSHYFENPVDKYLLTKRLTNDWEKIENLMQHQEGRGILKEIRKYFIDKKEYYGGIDGLIRIQDTYRLKTSDVAQGILQGVKYDVEFDARLCYDIGKRALEKKFKLMAHSWFKEALKRFPEMEHTNEISFTKLNKLDIELALTNAKYKLGDIQGANQSYVDLVNLYSDSEKVAKRYATFLEKSGNMKTIEIDYSLDHKPIAKNITKTCQSAQYKYTCADILKKSPSEERNLYCRYLKENHPFLRLAPLKQEIMNFDPFLAIFHDVISDNEINIMRSLTKQVKRAKVKSRGKTIISDGRTSQFTFIKVSKHPALGVIDRRVEDMTNLNMKYSEMHQFANYGIGGHYVQHHDYFAVVNMKPELVNNFEMGNRIATVLFYLTDVEQGGGTAFPYLKLHLKPKKGSAAFWYNLHHTGDRDVRTMHGACPIIVGSKWVQNRWIREHDQSDRRPCLLYNDSI